MNPARKFPEWMKGLKTQCTAESDYDSTGKRWALFLLPEEIKTAAGRLCDHGFFLEDIAGIDSQEGLVAVYHFDRFTRPGRVALYVTVTHDQPEIPSISNVFSGAAWHERECHDFFGIRFTGHPDLSPILVPHDMERYPLIKETTQRASLNNLLTTGEILDRHPDFALFHEKEAKNPDGGNACNGPKIDGSDRS